MDFVSKYYNLKLSYKRMLGLVLFLLCVEIADGQYFSRHYSLYAGTNGYISSIQVVNDTIYAMCYVGDSIDPALGIAAFERFDKYGNLISYNPIDTAPLLNILANNNTLVHTNDGGFAYGASIGVDSIANAIVILKFDHYGNLEWYKEIVENNTSAFQCDVLIQDSFSNYYLTGITQSINSNYCHMYLTKSDSIGNLIYTKTYIRPNFNGYGNAICFNNKGHIILGGDELSYNINNFSSEKDFMDIYELDTAGNVLNSVLGTDSNGLPAYHILPSNDGGYLISSAYFCFRDVTEGKWRGAIAKLDSNFSVVWKFDAGPCSQQSGFFAQKKCTDGNYISVGSWYDDSAIVPHINGWVIKYSENGQILWSNLYRGVTSDGPNGDNNVLGSIAFMSDNSIICAGQATNYDGTVSPIQQGWLLHLDTAGCLPDSNSCGIPDGIDDIPKNNENVKLFPNPASRTVVVSGIPNNATLSVFDMTGRICPVVISGNQIDVSALMPGMYCLQIQSAAGIETRKFVKE